VLSIEPGTSATVDLGLRNDGTAPEIVRLAVEGPARPYSFVVPDTLTVDPGGEAVVRVGFRMPRTSLPAAGPLPFTVTAVGTGGQGAAEGQVDVAPFSVLSATLDPPETEVARSSTHELCVGNRGNAPVRVTLEPADAAGVDIRIDPPAVVASADGTVTAKVEVTPRHRPFTGAERDLPFRIVATPEFGTAVEVAGRLRQRAAVATRTLVTSGVVAGLAVVALVLGLTAFSGGSSPPGGGRDDARAGVAAPRSDCPAEGHKDPRGISGLRPEDIPNLPNSYSFLFVKDDNCTPVRFNPCEPIHYVQNLALAPPTGAEDVREAFNRLSQATGITFVDDGTTDETRRRGPPYFPERYGNRWAPILVDWQPFGDQGPDPTIQAVGFGIPYRFQDVLVSGVLTLNVDAVTDKETRTPVQGGFGPPLGSGVGAIGPKDVTWGRIILHELAHVMGLGHTRDKGAIMYPETAEQTSRPADLRPPDREGLRYLGREAGCLTTPSPPTA
jgi:hypothetical protein